MDSIERSIADVSSMNIPRGIHRCTGLDDETTCLIEKNWDGHSRFVGKWEERDKNTTQSLRKSISQHTTS